MRAEMQNGRAATEVTTPPVAAARALIPHGDKAKDSEAASNGQRHSLDAVGIGIARFLNDFRERQSLDAEWEFAESCRHRCGYPAAIHGECFTCAAAGKLPC